MARDYWDFLIQKEGKRSWQKIESSNLELDVGRYRVVAHTSRSDTDVEICVSHQSLTANPPKRRYQKRCRRTNSEGLIVVIPFTYLKPGLWELRCCGDVMSDFLGDSWQAAVRLQVAAAITDTLPQHTPVIADERQGGEAAQVESVTATSARSEVENSTEKLKGVTSPEAAIPIERLWDRSLQEIDQVLEQVIEPVLAEFDPVSESTKEAQAALIEQEPLPLEFSCPTDNHWPELRLTLDEDAFIVVQGESLTVTGIIELEQEAPEKAAQPFHGSVRYELWHPETSTVLLDVRQPLSTESFPLPFKHALEIPRHAQTCLMLGKITLYSASQTSLASQPFTVTAHLEELLGSIVTGSKAIPVAKLQIPHTSFTAPQAHFQSPLSVPPVLNHELLDLVNTPLSEVTSLWQLSEQKPLPPQLHQSLPKGKVIKSPQLPAFCQESHKHKPRGLAQLRVTTGLQRDDHLPPLDRDAQNRSNEELPTSKEATSGDSATPQEFASPVTAEVELTPPHTRDSTSQQMPAIAPELEEEDNEVEISLVNDQFNPSNNPFPTSSINDNFWLRLNSLVSSPTLSRLLESKLEANAARDRSPCPQVSPEAAIENGNGSRVVANDWRDTEIVVDDEEPPVIKPTKIPENDSFEDNSSEVPPLQLESSIPAPQLFVSSQDLKAGETVTVRVSLPPHSSSVYVKLWIQDRQSRSVLGESYSLVDFAPNGSGELETLTQLTVPFGSAEIRFEAVAIDRSNQRQSHKVGVNCIIVPSEMSTLSLDELELNEF